MNEEIDILINKNNRLDYDYIPTDLISLDDNENNFHDFFDEKLKPSIRKVAYSDYIELICAAKKDNVLIIADSAYRSYQEQINIWNYYENKIGYEGTVKRVAPVGASEHQLGLAIDFAALISCNKIRDLNEIEYAWLINNSYKYGFILRYPKGKELITGYSYEPWHFRYVGKYLSKYIHENELTLEEYHLIKKRQIMKFTP